MRVEVGRTYTDGRGAKRRILSIEGAPEIVRFEKLCGINGRALKVRTGFERREYMECRWAHAEVPA